jgi:hypothetical protein
MSLDFNIASTVSLLASSAESEVASITNVLAGSSGPNLASTASLLAATLDLKLVESLINAIRTADLIGAAELGNRTAAARPNPAQHTCPARVVEPRINYHPQPYFEPRPIYYTAVPHQGNCRVPAETNIRCDAPTRVADCELPFQPPWKVLPWQNPPPVILKIKVVGHRPDEAQKGRMIDLLI